MSSYLFLRTYWNDDRWERPSIGRMDNTDYSGDIVKSGYGGDDWNFSKESAIDGFIYGYTYPSVRPRQEEPLNIAWITKTRSSDWHLCGFYFAATWVDKPPEMTTEVLRKRLRDLQRLRNASSLGPKVDRMLRNGKARDYIAQDFLKHNHLKVNLEDVISLRAPIALSPNSTQPKHNRFGTPSYLVEADFDALLITAGLPAALGASIGTDAQESFPEGRRMWVKHQRLERDPALVNKAKLRFKKMHGRLFCQICKFDFGYKYPSVGCDYIEAHHTVPVSQLPPNSKVKVDDIALVCANCHRMLHRRRPWLSMRQLCQLLT